MNEDNIERTGSKRKRFFDFKTFDRPRKKLKLSVQIPETFKNFPQYQMLKQLETAEKKIDGFLEERRSRLVRSSNMQKIERRKLQIEIYHDNVQKVSKQVVQFDINISGSFVDGGDLVPFSEMVDQIEVEFPNLGLDKGVWKASEDLEENARHNIISFERSVRTKKNRIVKVEAGIYLRHDPPLYHMDKRIQNITDDDTLRNEALTYEEIINLFFDYFREKNLFAPNNPTMIFLDENTSSMLRREVVHINEVSKLIYPFLSLPDPIVVRHSFDFQSKTKRTKKSFEVDRNRSNFNVLSSDQYNEDVLQKESEIKILLDEAKSHMRKKEFFEGFSQNPIDFSYQLICSQTRDINVVNNHKMDNLMKSKDFREGLTDDTLVCMEEETM